MRILKALLLPLLLILSLIGVDRLSGKPKSCREHKTCEHTGPPVGASLLAIAVVQSTALLNVPISSRAGSLPKGLCAGQGAGH
ncbi:hypothetical protein SAMN03159297_02434 [Pseudomonas sp. NFACC45]|nr:hypothetical protein SAMN03159297_02434 [Pseudomonas sp. NFACC45]